MMKMSRTKQGWKRVAALFLSAALAVSSLSMAAAAAPTGHTVGSVQPTDLPVNLLPPNETYIHSLSGTYYPSVNYEKNDGYLVTGDQYRYSWFSMDIHKWIDVRKMPVIHFKITSSVNFSAKIMGYKDDASKPNGSMDFARDFAESFRTSSGQSNIVNDPEIGTAIAAGTYDVYLNVYNLVQNWPCVVQDGYLYLDNIEWKMATGISGMMLNELSVPAAQDYSIGYDMMPVEGLSTLPTMTYTAADGSTATSRLTMTSYSDGSVKLVNQGGSYPGVYTDVPANRRLVDLNSNPFLYYDFVDLYGGGYQNLDIGVNAVIWYIGADGVERTATLSAFTDRIGEDFRDEAFGYVDFRTYLKNRGRLPDNGIVQITKYRMTLYGNPGAAVVWKNFGFGPAPVDLLPGYNRDPFGKPMFMLMPNQHSTIGLGGTEANASNSRVIPTYNADGSVKLVNQGGGDPRLLTNINKDFNLNSTPKLYYSLSSLTLGRSVDLILYFTAKDGSLSTYTIEMTSSGGGWINLKDQLSVRSQLPDNGKINIQYAALVVHGAGTTAVCDYLYLDA